jgi:TFIIF-interacting CTD phosphatase-like protein
VGAFLLAVSSLYELHIYTMGDKAYAALIAKLLDPSGRLFGDRVISQVGCGGLTWAQGEGGGGWLLLYQPVGLFS